MEIPTLTRDELSLEHLSTQISELLAAIQGPVVDLVSNVTAQLQGFVPASSGVTIPDVSGFVADGFAAARSAVEV